MTDKPNFRFFPKAYETEGVFRESNDICDSCGKPSVWMYSGPLYSQGNPNVCARCIADGSLDKILGVGKYSFQDCYFPNVPTELSSEIMQRTPRVTSYNPINWPILESKPLAFFGYGDNDETWKFPDAVDAMKMTWRQAIGKELNSKSSYLLVFKELDGPRFIAVMDLD